ncbi:Auxin-induced in root cultures protein 12 precursor, putative [Ricinus communis]|uniref:Auxin-induced in root cultures protein 12, putative n=1 Tax=Ricinus communis TaxID=3988 RepID=B9T492_RICCO|nr:Auxin-induced in root cultures protein 12 precursor, putative [Ricinus communis]|eukprot:XP_002533061.1 auxin-induced in root cultures protein 12 [Ricinus communis]
MASADQLIVTVLLLAALLITPSYSLTCTSQKFTSDKTFTDCIDLPVLDAYLHYTYNSTNASLSIAYIAAPAKPDGWVAWAINPKSSGMVGAQTLLAYKSKVDSVAVKTYDITAYGPLKESKLSFDVWDLRGESNGDNLVIFATVKVPEKAKEVNQVWQVGPAVTDGNPSRHEMNEANTNSKGVLKLVGGGGESSPAPGGSTPETPAAPHNAAISTVRKLSMASCLGVIVLIGSFIGF